MSWRLVDSLLAPPPLKVFATDHLVLLALAKHCKNQDAAKQCWPAIKTLASETWLTPRAVQKALRRLEHLGLVKVRRGGGRRNASRYEITIAAIHRNPEPRSPLNPEQRSPFRPKTLNSVHPNQPKAITGNGGTGNFGMGRIRGDSTSAAVRSSIVIEGKKHRLPIAEDSPLAARIEEIAEDLSCPGQDALGERFLDWINSGRLKRITNLEALLVRFAENFE